MSAADLTPGAIMRLATCPDDDEAFNSGVVLQALSVKSIGKESENTPKPGTTDRLRIILSDGEWFMQAMLATQLNDLEIPKNAIVRLTRASRNIVQNRRLVIVLGLEILAKCTEKLKRDPNNAAQPVTLPASYLTINPGEPGAQPAAPTPQAGKPSPAPAAPRTTSTPQLPAQPHRDSKNTAPNGRSCYPIEGLSPYQNNWTIKARVTQKSDIRKWSNQRGEGRLFNVTLMDETGEIRATGFNQAVDELFDKFEEGKVYYVSKARVNLAKKKFSTVNNDYELSLERTTEVEPCLETTDVPTIKYSFVKLDQLQDVAKDATCDVIGVVKEVSDLSEITTKTTNRTMKKRELTLVDDTGFSVRVTLWGNTAENYNEEGNPVIAFKGAKVGDFGGRSLSMMMNSTMSVNPDNTEAFHLRGWFDDDGKTAQFASHTAGGSTGGGRGFDHNDERSLTEIKNAQLGMSDKVDYFSVRTTVMHIKDNNFAYPACRNPGCNKKVLENAPGEWRCEKCNVTHTSPDYRYMLQLAVADLHGQAWFQGFNDAGQVIFNMSANELMAMKEQGDDDGVLRAFARANYQAFNFNCRAKADTWNDETRVRYGILSVAPVDYVKEAELMRERLQSDWAA